jgi:hypothetical protein
MGKRGPKPKGAAHHIMTGNYRPGRHGPRPVRRDTSAALWDEFLTPPPDDPPPTDAELPREEREAIALAQMGWKLPG